MAGFALFTLIMASQATTVTTASVLLAQRGRTDIERVHAPAPAAGSGAQAAAAIFGLARMLLVAGLALAPLAFGAVQAWAWASLGVLAMLLLTLWTIAGVQQQTVRIIWSPLYLPALLFLVLVAIQYYGNFTQDPVATRESLLKITIDLILFFLAGQLWTAGPVTSGQGKTSVTPRADEAARMWSRFGLTVTLLAFALAVFAILQFFSSGGLIYWAIEPRWGGWVFGPYVNHNHYAGLMEMLIPVAFVYVFCQPRSLSARVFFGFSVMVPLASVLLSGSRGGMISLLFEVSILGAILVASTRKPQRPVATGLLLIAAAALLFAWLDPGQMSERLATVVNAPSQGDESFALRRRAALDSLRIFREHPWLGTGAGSFDLVYARYRSFPSNLDWDHAHNDYAEALAETGLAGGLCILWATVVFFFLAFRDLRPRLGHPAGWIQLGAAVGCCGLLVHSYADFNLHIPANAAWFAVCAGMAGTHRGSEFHRTSV